MVTGSPTLTHGIDLYPIKVLNSDKSRQAPRHHLMQLTHGTANQHPITEAEKLAGYWHHRLEHLPLVCLRRHAARGVLPACIENVTKLPLCAACQLANAQQKSSRGKGEIRNKIGNKRVAKSGNMVSDDHMMSSKPGLIPQVTGTLTHRRYVGAVIFVDHFSDLPFVHLLENISDVGTTQAKFAFEKMSREHGVQIKRYHADNSRFVSPTFMLACNKLHQTYSYCGVGSHHQNGVAEAKVKQLTQGGRTLLLHAQSCWPAIIKPLLWPLSLLAATDRYTRLHLNTANQSPLEIFTNTDKEIIPVNYHKWVCPVFILRDDNQSGLGRTPKWEPCGRTGVYLGHSPLHAGNVALVLSLQTGHCSPQYHVVFNDEFTTVPYLNGCAKPLNWINFVAHASERVPDNDYELAVKWSEGIDQIPLKPEPTITTKPRTLATNDDRILILEREDKQPPPLERDQHKPKQAKFAGELPPDTGELPPNTGESPPIISDRTLCSDETGEKVIDMPTPFIDVANIGTRQSKQIRKPSEQLRRLNTGDKDSATMRRNMFLETMFLVLVFLGMIGTVTSSACSTTAHCYQSNIIAYEDFLACNFDGTTNSTSPLVQIYKRF